MKKVMVSMASAILMLFLGLIYAWSIFVAPLESEFGWTRDQTSLTFTICMSFFCIGGLIASQIRKKLSTSVILIINAIVILIAFVLTSRLTSLWQLYILYGVLCGFSVGCAYNCILSVVPLYFPKRIGLINGVLLLAFGLGGWILGALAKNLISQYDWRTTFVYLGILFLVIFLIFCFFIRAPKANLNSNNTEATLEDKGYTPGQMIKHPYFWMFGFWHIFVSAMGLTIIGHAASVAIEAKVPGTLIAVAIGVVSAASGIGKFLIGLLYDAKGRAIAMTVASVVGFAGTIIVYISLQTFYLPLLLIGFFCCGASYGAAPACNATFTRKQFGSKHFSTNFAINCMSLLIGAFIGTYLIGTIRANSQNYSVSIIILGGYLLVSIILAQFVRKERD